MVFSDPRLKVNEENHILQRVHSDVERDTLDEFKKKLGYLGTHAFITNDMESTPQQLYETYQSRVDIDQLFKHYKNCLPADRSYMQSDQAFEAWMLINHCAIMMYYQLFRQLQAHDCLRSYSPADVLMHLTHVRKLNIQGEWLTAEINSQSKQCFDTLGIPVM